MATSGTVFCSLALCVLAVGVAVARLQPTLHKNAKRWDGARKACTLTQNTCDMAMRQTTDTAFWDAANLPVNEPYWVGARLDEVLVWTETKQPFIQSEGCFQSPLDLSKIKGRSIFRFKYNNPERCLSRCPTSAIALQNLTCYCLPPDVRAQLTQTSTDSCTTFCPHSFYKCGGPEPLVSVYRTPDRVLLDKRGSSRDFYWYLSNNNEQEVLVVTNTGAKKVGLFCRSEAGSYESRDLSEGCPAGSRNVSLENMDVADFIQMSGVADSAFKYFPLPMGYARKLVWIDGSFVQKSTGSGNCAAIMREENGRYLLTRRPCRDKLSAVCACESVDVEPTTTTTAPTTSTTIPTTTTTPIPTTVTTSTTTTTSTPTTTSTTTSTLPTSTTTSSTSTTTTPPPPPTTTTTSTTIATSTTSSTIPSTSSTMADTEQPSTMAKTVAVTTTTTAKTSTVRVATSPATTAAAARTTPQTQSPVTEPSKTTTSFKTVVTEPSHGIILKNQTISNDTASLNDDILFAPPVDSAAASSKNSNTRSASASIGMIIGVTTGCVCLMVAIVIAVILLNRKRRGRSQHITKKSKVSYPI